MTNGPTVLELFAGIGGLSLGLERAGFHVVGQVEINPFARSILTKHWPEVPKHDDVKTALAWWLSEPRPRVDCVAGGYPCQPESNAGKRLSIDDYRWLWPEFARIVHALTVAQDVPPRWVIGENVSGHRARGLRFVLRDLERLGYTARAGYLEAREVGAPHERKRVFIIAEVADAYRTAGRPEAGDALARAGGEAVRAGAAQPGRRGGDVADPHSVDGRAGRPGGPAFQGDPRHDQPTPGLDSGTGQGAAWPAEPGMGRVAHGVPWQLDRLRALGNAVVPKCGEHIGNLVLSGAWRDV